MCGLLGMIARKPQGFNYGDVEVFETMLLIDSIRGKDSTGVFTRFRNGDVRAIKHGSHPYNLFRSTEWGEFKSSVTNRGKFIVGHNRAATRGEVNTDNAHPFVEKNIILVHNGTLKDQKNLTDVSTKVDSHAIAHALAEESELEDHGDYKRVISKINGAFALIWYDTNTEKLYATRNDERPLCILESDNFMFLTSEAWIAAFPAQRAHIEIKRSIPIEPGEIFVFNADGSFNKEDVTLSGEFDDDAELLAWQRYSTGMRAQARKDCELFPKGTEMAPAKQAHSTPTPSKPCALTLAKDTSPSSDEDQAEARTASIHAYNEAFPRNETMLIKIHAASKTANGRFSFNGLVMTPGKERLDVKGFLPHDVSGNELPQWFETMCIGTVQHHTHTVNGGWTIHVKDTKKATFTQVHSKEVPVMLWDYAMNHGCCMECQRKVEAWEKVFTTLVEKHVIMPKKEKPVNVLTMLCPDCIAKKIEREDYRDKYLASYTNTKKAIEAARTKAASSAAAVQDRLSVSKESGSINERTLRLQNPKTVH